MLTNHRIAHLLLNKAKRSLLGKVERFKRGARTHIQAFKIAVKAVGEQSKDVMLLLAGEDSQQYAHHVKDYAIAMNIADQVSLRTNLSFIIRNLLYSASDIFISVSDNIQETFGLTVLEAMSSGLPVIVSDWNGYKETVVHSKTGFKIPTYWLQCDDSICALAPISNLFDWKTDHLYIAQSTCVDVRKMAEYITIFIKNRDIIEGFAQNARRHVIENYDWRVVIPLYEELWEELYHIAHHSPPPSDNIYLFRPQYFNAFKHYATCILSDETEFRSTKYGLDVAAEQAPCGYYNDMESKLSFDVICDVIEAAGNWMALAQIIEIIQSKHNVPVEEIRFQVMWMLKYNLLECKNDILLNSTF